MSLSTDFRNRRWNNRFHTDFLDMYHSCKEGFSGLSFLFRFLNSVRLYPSFSEDVNSQECGKYGQITGSGFGPRVSLTFLGNDCTSVVVVFDREIRLTSQKLGSHKFLARVNRDAFLLILLPTFCVSKIEWEQFWDLVDIGANIVSMINRLFLAHRSFIKIQTDP